MLDLDSLFGAQAAAAAVHNCAQKTTSCNVPSREQDGSDKHAAVPKHANATKSAESHEPWDSRPDSPQRAWVEVGHSGHNGYTPVFDEVCPRESLPHKAFDGLGTVGTLGTVDFQGGEGQTGNGAPGGGAARESFALHPAAVILALAYCRKVKANNDERVSSMLSLEAMPPGEQVKHWHSSCIKVGIKPWEVLTLPAPSSGLDCTMCKHLVTRQMAAEGGRRQFHWACGLGYLILETGRGTERIWIAPPDCQSFVRWQPGSEPPTTVTFCSDRLSSSQPLGR